MPLKLGESYPYLGFSSGLLIDYGLGDALISLHGLGCLILKLGELNLYLRFVGGPLIWFWFKLLFNVFPWVFLPLNYD